MKDDLNFDIIRSKNRIIEVYHDRRLLCSFGRYDLAVRNNCNGCNLKTRVYSKNGYGYNDGEQYIEESNNLKVL